LALQKDALPELQRAAAAEIEHGRLWRLAFDTYEREIERYGGPSAIEIVESVFAADSAAVVEPLAETEQAEARLDLALLGVDALLDELGLAPEQKRAALSGLAAGLRARLGPAAPAPRELGMELRECRSRLQEARHELRKGRPPAVAGALRKRATEIAPLAHRLAELDAGGELATPLSEIAKSLAHMHVNRLLREPEPEAELRVYDRLDRLYRSEAARAS
jgi:lantibiotic biosynthesis protein